MFQVTNFCGASGQSYHFKKVSMEKTDWLGQAGVVIFTTFDGRVIQVIEQLGRAEDINAIWRVREARRYGAAMAYFRAHREPMTRSSELKDLVCGLDPVCGGVSTSGDAIEQMQAEHLSVAA